jgi:S1-C subfamily serine protease
MRGGVAHRPAMRHNLAVPSACVLAVLLLASPAGAQKAAPSVPSEGRRTSGEGFNLPGKPPPLGAQASERMDPGEMPRVEGPRGDGGSGRVPSASDRPSSSGTGFVVADGKVMTNNHVVDECGRMVVRNAAGTRYPAKVDTVDRRRDLALMTVPSAVGPALTFRDNPPIQRGEVVVTYGFPLSGLLSSGPTLTTGDVSALAGLRDNPVNLQISAPVQPGNSGGPLLDSQANVIGVVVSKLNAARIAEITGGDIPQNVNFAVKGTEALSFLRANGVQPKVASSTGADKRNTEIGQIANLSTVHVLCYK